MRPRENGSSGRTGPSYSTEPGASTASLSLARRDRSVAVCARSQLMMLAVVAALAAADDRRLAARVEAIVPVPPTEHQRVHYFGRRHHHLVPGTVTINGAAYLCDLDGKRFVNRDVFV